MRLEVTGRHVTIAPVLRRLVVTKLARVERLLNDGALSAQVVLTREKHRHKADITLHARGERFLHGVADTGSWETSLSEAVDKLAQQAQKVKGKWQERKRSGRQAPPVAAAQPAVARPPTEAPRVRARMPRMLRASRQALKAMSVAAAAREIDVSPDGVVVFRDEETAAFSVLYRRSNGELALVQAET